MLRKLATAAGTTCVVFGVGAFVYRSSPLPNAMCAAAQLKKDTSPNIAFAPNVPPPIKRQNSAHLVVHLQSTNATLNLSPTVKYAGWGFNGQVPGPIIRARVGDLLELHHTNNEESGMAHNIDFHAVTGPGGGASVLLAEKGETKTARFKLLSPGVFIYHCAANPLPTHIQNGMYGLIIVEPETGLPPVDREFYVMQAEFYTQPSEDFEGMHEASFQDGLIEHPSFVLFNGAGAALVNKPLCVKQGERVRIFFGNIGPNLVSNFHIIGTIFDKVYREADLISPPARGIQTTLVPAGGAVVVEFDAIVPGNYTLTDHAIFRTEKGAVGFIKVAGKARPDIYESDQPPMTCPGCRTHD